jgi:hypothetical protein
MTIRGWRCWPMAARRAAASAKPRARSEAYVGKLARGERRAGPADAESAGSAGESAEDFYPHESGWSQRICAPISGTAERRKYLSIRYLRETRP